MNRNERTRLVVRTSSFMEQAGSYCSFLKTMLLRETEKLDNLPDGLEGTDLAEGLEDCIDRLQQAVDAMDEVIVELPSTLDIDSEQFSKQKAGNYAC